VISLAGWGLVCALGDDAAAVAEALAAGATGLSEHPPLARMPGPDVAGVVRSLDLRRWLKRRKDQKLMARPSQLLLPAAGVALGDWPGERLELGLFVGVGREPPDEGDSQAALVASARDGALDDELLAGPGRDRYPPLLPLQTLPNMALAHVSIHLDIGGENGAWAGGAAAGLRAMVAGIQAVAEGRCPAALVGASDAQADRGSQRDRLRLGLGTPPGEGAAAALLVPDDGPVRVAALAPADAAAAARSPGHHAGLGDCGAGDGLIAVVLAAARVAAGHGPQVVAFADPGQPAVGVRLSPS